MKIRAKMKILVTGGAGFIGSHFVDFLFNQQEHEIAKVVVLDALTYAGNLDNLDQQQGNSKFEFVQGDINNAELVEKLLDECHHLVNFAAESHVDRSITNSKEFINTNILGTQNLLDVSRFKNIRKYLQVSTDEVYGSISEGSWDESEPLLPNSPYAASKASADLITRSYFKTYNLPAVISRCSNNYGPRQNEEKLIPHFINRLLRNEQVPIYGDGMNVRDWLFVEDHCDALFRILMNGRNGDIYNIGGGRELNNIQIADLLIQKMGKDESSKSFVADRPGHDLRYSVDWRKIESEIGYKPNKVFEKGISETIEWYSKQHNLQN